MTKEDIHFSLTKKYDWFDIKLLIDFKKVCDKKLCINDETDQNEIKFVFNKLNTFSTHFLHFGCGIGSI